MLRNRRYESGMRRPFRGLSTVALWALLTAWYFAGLEQTAAAPQETHPSASSSVSGSKTSSTSHSAQGHSKGSAHAKTSTTNTKSSKHHAHHPLSAKALARSHSLQRAFVASSQLRPMAQELIAMRTPAAYAGVNAYAQSHSGEASSAAYLAIGHAYLTDRKFPEAASNLQKSVAAGQSLSDYADYLAAQVYLQSNNLPAAETVLSGFAAK